MLLKYNPVLDTDSYKYSHWLQYPPGSDGYFGYAESRVGSEYKNTMFFGMQYLLKSFLSIPVTKDMVDEAESLVTLHGEPFNRSGWDRLINVHGGHWPVLIKAAPEGLLIPESNVLFTVESTDPELFWIPSFLETQLIRLWYPMTVATASCHLKKDIGWFHGMTAGNFDAVSFSLHDFGARGVSSFESSALGGMAHLVNFAGSDTIAAIRLAQECYGVEEGLPGYSIPAAEHSTITSWGRDGEEDAYRNMIKRYGKDGAIFAVVSDSYDIYHAIEHLWGDKLKSEVLDSKATLVIRPDSGDPVEVVTKCLNLMRGKFGYTRNRRGYTVLNNVKLIQGDGCSPDSIHDILENITSEGFCATNVAFGMGGGLLQKWDRDTQRFAFKCSAISVDGEWRDVFKSPITDPGKNSKAGRLKLIRDLAFQGFHSVPLNAKLKEGEYEDILLPVFKNGEILKEYSFDEVRSNSRID